MTSELNPNQTQFSRGCDSLGEEEQGGPERSDGDPRGEKNTFEGAKYNPIIPQYGQGGELMGLNSAFRKELDLYANVVK